MTKEQKREISVVTVFDGKQDVQQAFIELMRWSLSIRSDEAVIKFAWNTLIPTVLLYKNEQTTNNHPKIVAQQLLMRYNTP